MNLLNKKFIKVPHLTFLEALKEGGRNPFVDWITILIVSITIGIASVACSVLLYKKVVGGDFQNKVVENTTQAKVFDKGDLMGIINKFDRKSIIHDEMRKGS